MWLPKLRELKEAVTAVVKGPYTSKFPAEPPTIPDGFRGRPRYDEDECVGCGACFNMCPPGAIEMVDDVDAKMRRLTIHLDRCIYCETCHVNCLTEKGVNLTKEYEFATTDRNELREEVQKKLLLCETCNAVIGAEDHVRWVAERLGPVSFANPTLMLTTLQNLSMADRPSGEVTHPLRRGDRVRIQCPKCRQVTAYIA